MKKVFMILMICSCTPKVNKVPSQNELKAVVNAETTNTGNSSVTVDSQEMGNVYQDRLFSYTSSKISQLPNSVTFNLKNAPTWMSVDQNTGIVSGTPTQVGPTMDITLEAINNSNGSLALEDKIGVLTVMGDPLRQFSWHLFNLGSNGMFFSTNKGSSTVDLNILDTWNYVRGSGIRVVVSDSGLEIKHPDLATNSNNSYHKDYNIPNTPGNDPTPIVKDQEKDTEGDHGTSCAGIIGAAGWDNIGMRGIAPEATLIGYNHLSQYKDPSYGSTDIDQALGDHHIYNQSWGPSWGDNIVVDSQTNSETLQNISLYSIDKDYMDILESGVENQRNQLGSLYVRAAGNDFSLTFNANFDEQQSNPFLIIVGAYNAHGKRSGFSNVGSNLWISAPGGADNETDPGIVSTDLSTCQLGYNKTSVGSLIYSTKNYDSNCDYTMNFNGTSAAAPMVTGGVALILQANPQLSWRDVKYILAKTAIKIDASSNPNTSSAYPKFIIDTPPSNFYYERGWIKNAAGLNFHNWYGFGAMDIHAAVEMAKNYSLNSWGSLKKINKFSDTTWKYTTNANSKVITDNSIIGVESTTSITENYTIESLMLRVNIKHPLVGEVGLELESPSGTKSILINVNNAVDSTEFSNLYLLSNAFFMENSQGTWKLRAYDVKNGNQGTLESWSINIYGH